MFSLPLLSRSDETLNRSSSNRSSANKLSTSRRDGSHGTKQGHSTGQLDSCGSISQQTMMNLIVLLMISCVIGQNVLADEAADNMPCICNGTFYRVCPPFGDCRENIISPLDLTEPNDLRRYDQDYQDDHDDYDPDHISSPFENHPYRALSEDALDSEVDLTSPYAENLDRSDIDPGFAGYQSEQSSDGRSKLFRKVYVAPKKKGDVAIHNLRIRIPLKMPMMEDPVLPDPPRLFKFKKYTTFENKPEVKMVPVSKTIIKPVGIDPSQIVGDRSLANF